MARYAITRKTAFADHPSDADPAFPTMTDWERYRETRDADLRDRLVNAHLKLVSKVASQVKNKVPQEVDVNDLEQEGVFGLMNAIDGFDAERGVKFTTYATQRVHGAIYDYLRQIDWVPRLARSRHRSYEQVKASLHKEFGREPTDHEMMEVMELDSAEFDRVRRDAQIANITSINRPTRGEENDRENAFAMTDVLTSDGPAGSIGEVEREDLRKHVTKHLPRDERLIVMLYYYEQLSMREIGATLGISESRVSQKHKQILDGFKSRFGHKFAELDPAGV